LCLMQDKRRHFSDPAESSTQLPSFIGWGIFVGSTLVILYLTLKAFDFRLRPLTLQTYLQGFILGPSSLLDFPHNILLFMPFGFGLGALLSKRGWPSERIWPAVALCGFLLTWSVESLQLFLPARTPSLSDILGNTLGALAGMAVFRLWQQRTAVAQRLATALSSPRFVIISLLGYTLVLLMLALLLGASTHFGEWRPDYPLLIGNERGGRRPWRGKIQDVAFFDLALSDAEAEALLRGAKAGTVKGADLLAYYPLAGLAPFADETGHQPPLVWRPGSRIAGPERDLDGRNWLQSKTAVSNLTLSLQDTSQVTVSLTAAAESVDQRGPARIVSISNLAVRRNLTIGQDQGDLVLRLNTPVAGENGDALEMHFPEQFRDTSPTRMVITFDGLSARLYSSAGTQPQTIEIIPGPAFYRYLNPYLPRNWQIDSSPRATWFYRLLFYFLLLLPAGLLLGATWRQAWPASAKGFVLAWTLLIIPLLLEWGLVYRSGHPLRMLNVLLAGACLAALGLITGLAITYLWPGKR
jgi:hypothetical protein